MVQVYGMNERIGQVSRARVYHDSNDFINNNLNCSHITLNICQRFMFTH